MSFITVMNFVHTYLWQKSVQFKKVRITMILFLLTSYTVVPGPVFSGSLVYPSRGFSLLGKKGVLFSRELYWYDRLKEKSVKVRERTNKFIHTLMFSKGHRHHKYRRFSLSLSSCLGDLGKVPSQKLRRPNPTVGFGRIWSDLVGFGRIWSDLVGFGRIQSDLVGFGRNWSDSVGFGRNWSESVGSGRT